MSLVRELEVSGTVKAWLGIHSVRYLDLRSGLQKRRGASQPNGTVFAPSPGVNMCQAAVAVCMSARARARPARAESRISS